MRGRVDSKRLLWDSGLVSGTQNNEGNINKETMMKRLFAYRIEWGGVISRGEVYAFSRGQARAIAIRRCCDTGATFKGMIE